MTEPRLCMNCRFWQEENTHAPRPGGVGECRIRAITIVAGAKGYEGSEWPLSMGNDWCGEFEVRT